MRPLDKATPVIHDSELVSRVLSAPPARDCPAAFFSTELRGIVTHPAFMLVHVDDHMVHRGHAVFETCVVVDGHVYQLEAHLDRFFASCEAARVDSPLSREDVRRVVLHTAAAARALDGHIRLWASAGRGTFGVSPRGCARGTLYWCACACAGQLQSRCKCRASVALLTQLGMFRTLLPAVWPSPGSAPPGTWRRGGGW